MKPEPRVSLIILNWNGLGDTLECLASISSLDYENYDVIVIDNGSSGDDVQQITSRFPDVIAIQNSKNLGYAEGNNVGIRYALDSGTDYCLVLNNDITCTPSLLRRLVNTAELIPEAGIIAPIVYYYDRPQVIWFAGASWNSERGRFYSRFELPDEGPYETDYAVGCSFLVSRNVFARTGLFDPRYFLTWEEVDLCYRARDAGFGVFMDPGSRVFHKVSQSFERESDGALYRYYFTRNRLLWITTHLHGEERRTAIHAVLNEILSDARRFVQKPNASHLNSLAVQMRALWHFLFQKYGPDHQV